MKKILKSENIEFFPVLHQKMEFSQELLKKIRKKKPHAIAVELPPTIKEMVLKGVNRLPYLSVVVYRDKWETMFYLPIEPTSPIIVACRFAVQNKIPLYFIDLDQDLIPENSSQYPDSYSVFHVGVEKYYKTVNESKLNIPKTQQDDMREKEMAYQLDKISGNYSSILCVCGMSHVKGIQQYLLEDKVKQFGKVKRSNVRIYNLHPDSVREVACEIPFVMALFEFSEFSGMEMDFAFLFEEYQKKIPEEKILQVTFPDRTGNQEKQPEINQELRESIRRLLESLIPQDKIDKLTDKIFCEPSSETLAIPESEFLFDEEINFLFSEDSIDREQAVEALIEKHERRRGEKTARLRNAFQILREKYGNLNHDRQKILFEMIHLVKQEYKEYYKEEVSSDKIMELSRYMRNYAILKGKLLVGLFELIISARSMIDHNFAYELWDIATYYPYIDLNPQIETVRINSEDIQLGERKIRFDRKFNHKGRVMRKRKLPDNMRDWAKDYSPDCLCSYPPEDISVENFFEFLQKKGIASISEDLSRSVEFTSSVMDGIDMKETLKKYHDGKKIYVRENFQVKSGVGALIIIFEKQDSPDQFPYETTWYREHENESDMAFYSTHPEDNLVGPGVFRCEYGGFLMVSYPGSLDSVFENPLFNNAKSRPEILLMAGILFSAEKHILYCASSPPRDYFRFLAAKMDKKILYCPFGHLSPVMLKKIRVFHILNGHEIRNQAHNYIY